MRFSAQLTVLLTALGALAAPASERLDKRIAQVIADATAKWEQACLSAGGAEACNPLSVTAFSTLLAAPGPCEQQDAADQMIALATKLNNDAEMIRLTKIFMQQPRNTPNSVSTPYCQKAPASEQLNGLFQCQFSGSSPSTFAPSSGGGNLPFGLTALSPLGSCPAHPSGPIADGTQLVDQVTDPGTGSTAGTSPAAPAQASATAITSSAAAVTATSAASTTTAVSSGSSSSPSSSSGSSSNFALANGQAAQALNAKFATLTPDSSCNEGDQACVDSQFAQCVGGKFALTSCGSGIVCAALPLVNSAGTSITCDTLADAVQRIENTGATGGLTGDGSSSSKATPSAANNAVQTSSAAAASSSSSGAASSSATTIQQQNAHDAQALNKEFATLAEGDSCDAGQQACISSQFAQCVDGSWVLTPCGSPLSCFALPLVNKRGTSITCDSRADATARFQQAGVTGGVDGSS